MAHRCICGESFPSPASPEVHGFAKGHKFICCDALLETQKTLAAHRHSSQHVKGEIAFENNALRADKDCGSCDKGGFTDSRLQQHMLDKHTAIFPRPHCSWSTLKDAAALAQHIRDTHHSCPQCLQAFRNSAVLYGHQKTSNHLFCLEHDLDFTCANALIQHLREDAHIGSFECTTCDRAFKTEIALNDHLDSIGHACVTEAAARQILNAKDAVTNLERHEEEQCTGVFTSPSALLFHLGSNTCKSGMTRNKLNTVVAKYHVNGHITGANSTGSLTANENGRVLDATTLPASVPTPDSLSISDASGVVLTPSNTSIGHSSAHTNGDYACSTLSKSSGVMLTPSASLAGSESHRGASIMPGLPIRHHAAQEWSFLNGVTPAITPTSASLSIAISPNATGQWPCHLCPCTFRKQYDL
ncbi:hypothetical protein LTR95_003722 [Oleoguttula sp. CCFEE 5521]